MTPDVAGLKACNSSDLVQGGFFASEKIVDLRGNDYRLEPNANFTPDGKWIVFRSNMDGEMAVYAVKVEAERGE
jgi:oligogalacturonide lyase